MSDFPLIVCADDLIGNTESDDLLFVDVSQANLYRHEHILGAVHLPYDVLSGAQSSVSGGFPDVSLLARMFSQLGISRQRHVVAYDNEGGANATRLLWILDVLGHEKFSLLSGGLRAWKYFEGAVVSDVPKLISSDYDIGTLNSALMLGQDDVLKGLSEDDFLPLDARSYAEFCGEKCFAKRGGHIPGAVHFEWMAANDLQRLGQVRDLGALRDTFLSLGVFPDKHVVSYCQTNRRSTYVYWILKALGYPKISTYVGSWGEWGNNSQLPIEQGAIDVRG